MGKTFWRYFTVDIGNDPPRRRVIADRVVRLMSGKEQLLEALTFRHRIKGWVRMPGKIIICLTREVSLPDLRFSLSLFRKAYPDCDVTEVLCKGSVIIFTKEERYSWLNLLH